MQIDIHCRDSGLTESIREWAERRILFAVGQFGTRVRSVKVRLSDENGPKGGVDQRCIMEARLTRAANVVAEVHDSDVYAAVSRAADRLGRCVRTRLDRERTGRRTTGMPAERDTKRRRDCDEPQQMTGETP